MMKKLFMISLCFGFFIAKAQKDTMFSLYKTISVKAVDFAADNLDNIYIVTTSDQLKKLSSAGDSLAVYNEVKKFGKIYSMDVSNPLKIVLFYKSFSTVVVLDRFLSLKGAIDLRKNNIPEASAAAASYDNKIWIFDAVENKLKKLDDNGKQLMETPDLRQVFNLTIQPVKIIDQDQSVYLYDPQYGIFIFDHYGSFKKKYPLTQWSTFKVNDKNLIGFSNNALVIYNTVNLEMEQYQFPSSFGSFNRYVTGNTKLFALGKDTVSIYNFRFNLH
jgi:hypothetical protein